MVDSDAFGRYLDRIQGKRTIEDTFSAFFTEVRDDYILNRGIATQFSRLDPEYG